MEKDNYQRNSTGASKPKETKKKYSDYTAEELDAMNPSDAADLEAQAVCDALNDPDNHDKTH